MSLKRGGLGEVPEETAQVARAAFPKGNVYMRMRDEVGTLYEDTDFAALYPQRGQPALAPWRLALVTVMQFAENLTDRQAADAVRSRIDWKYALGLELTDPGFDYSVLSEFRDRLVKGEAEAQLLDAMLARFAERRWLKAHGRQRTDSTHILAAVRNLTRLDGVHETLRQALNRLARAEPAWLKAQITPEWFDRYGEQLDERRYPKEKAEQIALAEEIGRDGYHLLKAAYAASAPTAVRELAALEVLRQVWLQSYYVTDEHVHWRADDNIPPNSQMIGSPYDLEARLSTKRSVTWMGYKVHLTETCDDEDRPHLITHVETTVATTQDVSVVEDIHADLAAHDRTPAQHLVDSGYVEADALFDSRQQYGIDLVGPPKPDTSWQARDGQGFDLTHFTIDWSAQRITCPQGHRSQPWTSATSRTGQALVVARFSIRHCRVCPCRSLCTRAKREGRKLMLPPQPQYEALRAARQREQTEDFKTTYACRAGIEGTLSHATGALAMRRTRYIGLAKTHLQHVATAAAMNLARLFAWLQGKPRAKTRTSPFAALASV